MRKSTLFFLTLIVIACSKFAAFAQVGKVNTVAGCYICIATPIDGVAATLAQFNGATGIGVDASKNIYIADLGLSKVREVVASTGKIYTIAGNGTAGFSGDGGPATAALLSSPNGIFIDGANNVYIADAGNNRVRKIDAVTKFISTIAGGGVSTADGVPATTASITPECVYVDGMGNIYTGGSNKLRKINGLTGIITTIAGNGSGIDAGDGGSALIGSIAGPIRSITMDAASNIYIVTSNGDRVRKINASTGIITTVAGGGTCTTDGIPATLAYLSNVQSCVVDPSGNLIIADRGHGVIRLVDAANQNIYTIAGAGTSTAEGVSAMTAHMSDYMLCLDNAGGNLYYTDSFSWVRKMGYSPMSYSAKAVTSFSTVINKLCSGPEMTVTTKAFSPGLSITTWFGDGQSIATPITVSCAGGGVAVINHSYATSGTYTLKQVLYNGTAPVDSMHQTYRYVFCNALYVQSYFDDNKNCIKDANENFFQNPFLMEVDSNSLPIDTVSATAGFYYVAYGKAGDVYQFKPVLLPTGVYVSCPSIGSVSDTLQSLLYNTDTLQMGYSCAGTSSFDLSVHPVMVGSGVHLQVGKVYINQSSCSPLGGTATVTHSPKYGGSNWTSPNASSVTGNTITWNLVGLKYDTASTTVLEYDLSVLGGAYLKYGDTIHTMVKITPFAGDIDTTNNVVEIIDTVKAGFDPNEMAVFPSGCVLTSTKQLQYTINFENTGNDTAFNIYVMDTLPSYVDAQSMRIVMASTEMDAQVIKSSSYNILRFDFPNINLLDSSHHGLCDGAVIFTVNLKNSIPAGTIVSNYAGIFFDDNPVVITNTVSNIIGCPESVPEVAVANKVAVYPNPATNELTIKMDDGAYKDYTISNSIGQVMIQNTLTAQQTSVGIQAFPAGFYYVTLRGDNGTRVMKFVKM